MSLKLLLIRIVLPIFLSLLQLNIYVIPTFDILPPRHVKPIRNSNTPKGQKAHHKYQRSYEPTRMSLEKKVIEIFIDIEKTQEDVVVI